LCKTSTRALRLQIAEQQRQAELARQEAEKARKAQEKIQKEALNLQKKQMGFQKQQAAYVKETDAKMAALAERPAPPPPPPAAVVVTGGTAGMAAADNTQSAVDSRKRGRAALRIDLNAPQTAGGTGLNVPRG